MKCPECGFDNVQRDICSQCNASLTPGEILAGIMVDLAGLAAENERLRAALVSIADFCSGDGRNLGAVVRLAEVQSIARKALSASNGDQT